MDADDWLRDIMFEMESPNVAPASYVTFATFHLKGLAAQWWESHRGMLPAETVTTWQEFQLAFYLAHSSRSDGLEEEGVSQTLTGHNECG